MENQMKIYFDSKNKKYITNLTDMSCSICSKTLNYCFYILIGYGFKNKIPEMRMLCEECQNLDVPIISISRMQQKFKVFIILGKINELKFKELNKITISNSSINFITTFEASFLNSETEHYTKTNINEDFEDIIIGKPISEVCHSHDKFLSNYQALEIIEQIKNSTPLIEHHKILKIGHKKDDES